MFCVKTIDTHWNFPAMWTWCTEHCC